MSILKIGDLSKNGQITIVDEDRLCYIVQSMSRGAKGLRTISKNLLTEFVDYRKSHPNCSANDARDALSGKTGPRGIVRGGRMPLPNQRT